MPDGVIIGGWNYVIAAYTVLLTVVAIYAISLVRRASAAERAARDPSK
jgi:hypothetical protein